MGDSFEDMTNKTKDSNARLPNAGKNAANVIKATKDKKDKNDRNKANKGNKSQEGTTSVQQPEGGTNDRNQTLN